MQRLGRSLIVGVRDDDHGAFSSGWIAVDSGVTLEEHGDHCISMPGEGAIWIVSIYSMEVLAKLDVGATPTKLEAFGASAD